MLQRLKVFTLRTAEAEEEGNFERCVPNDGFSRHADMSGEAKERKKLERLGVMSHVQRLPTKDSNWPTVAKSY
ncbi:hypothetical protein ACFL2V_11695 [Pseudomonadota bacterium]